MTVRNMALSSLEKHISAAEHSTRMADDVAPTWRTVSEVVMKIVLSDSSLGYHNCSTSHPLLHPHADKIILLIKDYIYCKNVFEQSLGLFLLLAQCDLLGLKRQADRCTARRICSCQISVLLCCCQGH